MSEEKKVIEELKRTIKNSNYYDSIGTGQIEILLNYIDKLQQELKDSINARFELQRRIDKTQKENEELEKQRDKLFIKDFEFLKENYISKDKIRTKLEHAKEVLKNLDNEQDILVQKIVINYLEELLGE